MKLVPLLALPIVLAGCGGGNGGPQVAPVPSRVQGAAVTTNAQWQGGTVQLGFEEGYFIEGDDGVSYSPLNLSREFFQRGLRVDFLAKVVGPLKSQYGTKATVIHIIKIRRL